MEVRFTMKYSLTVPLCQYCLQSGKSGRDVVATYTLCGPSDVLWVWINIWKLLWGIWVNMSVLFKNFYVSEVVKTVGQGGSGTTANVLFCALESRTVNNH